MDHLETDGQKFNKLAIQVQKVVELLYGKDKIPPGIKKLLTECKEYNSLLSGIRYLENYDDLNEVRSSIDIQTFRVDLPEKKNAIIELLKKNTDLYNAVKNYNNEIITMSREIKNMSEKLKEMQSTYQKINDLIEIETEEVESSWDDSAGTSTELYSITLKGGKKLRKTKRRKPTKKIRRHTKRR